MENIDSTPSGEVIPTWYKELEKYAKWIIIGLALIIILVLIGVYGGPVLGIIGKILLFLLKAIWFIVSLPFKLIGKLFHREE